jgi:hypothetical protein
MHACMQMSFTEASLELGCVESYKREIREHQKKSSALLHKSKQRAKVLGVSWMQDIDLHSGPCRHCNIHDQPDGIQLPGRDIHNSPCGTDKALFYMYIFMDKSPSREAKAYLQAHVA